MELGDRVRLKPAEGKVIINPETNKPIPAEGFEVVVTVYWFRRFTDGDVLVVSAVPEAVQETKRAGKGAVAKKENTEV